MRDTAKSISSNFAYNFIKTISNIIFPVITFSYSSRILGVEGIGRLNFSRSIVEYFSMFAMLGINLYGTREAAKLKNDCRQLSKFTQEMLIINGVTTIFAYVIFAVIMSVTVLLREYAVLLWITSLSIFLAGMGIEWLYQGLEEYRYITVRSVIFQAIAIVVMFMTVREEKDLVNYAMVSLLASSGSYILNFWNCRKYIDFRYCGKYEIKKHLRPILWLFAVAVSVKLYTVFDSTMVGFFKGDRAVGIYSTAVRVNKLTTSLITSLGIVLLPRLSNYYADGDRAKLESLISKAYNFIFMLSIPACTGLYMLSDKIILLLSGSGFEAAGPTMRLLCPIMLMIPFSALTTNQLFVSMNKERKTFCSTFTGAVVNFSCNMLFIPKWSQNGAAIATVIAEIAVMCVCLYNIRKEINLKHIFRSYYQYWIAAIPIVGIAMLIDLFRIHYTIKIFFTVLCSVACYFSILSWFQNETFLTVAEIVSNKLRKIMHKQN
ncbi:MAG: flippase [Eubacterium sp.]|nr:flippase [Eubacterium sp.]